MYKIDKKLSILSQENDFSVANLLMNIHDELVYEVSIKHKKQVMEIIKYQMEDAICLSTAIPVW